MSLFLLGPAERLVSLLTSPFFISSLFSRHVSCGSCKRIVSCFFLVDGVVVGVVLLNTFARCLLRRIHDEFCLCFHRFALVFLAFYKIIISSV